MTEQEAAEALTEALGPNWNLADLASVVETSSFYHGQILRLAQEVKELREFKAHALRHWGVPT